jgi:hypothetical protein
LRFLTLCYHTRGNEDDVMNWRLFSLTHGSRGATRSPHRQEVTLPSNAHWKLAQPLRDESIRCLRGAVWITCEGQREDVVLTAGDEWKLPIAGVTLVGALSDAIVSVGAEPLKAAA